MNLIMFIIFFLTDISMIGIITFVYSGKEKYKEGMILGVHLPETEMNHEEVKRLGIQYKKGLRKFNYWNFILSTFLCFLCIWNLAYFVMLWTVWLILYIAIGMGLLYASHRKMYDIKMKYNWVMEDNTHIIHIDTITSAYSKKMAFSHWWNVIVLLLLGVILNLPEINQFFGKESNGFILPAVTIVMTILLWGLHLWCSKIRNVVYSSDSSINLSINRMEKRTWSIMCLSMNCLNMFGFSYLSAKIMRNQWLYVSDYMVYIVIQLISVLVIFAGLIYMHGKRKEVLARDTAALITDDDEYWKNGWYSNSNDTHLWVRDRMNSTNYTMNMAKPAAKVISAVTASIVVGVIAWLFVILIRLENTDIIFHKEENQITIDAAMYDSHFQVSEIQSVKIIEKLPEDDFTRTNGGATEKYLIGHFQGKITGKCMMYLYRDYTPILEIDLVNETIFVNSKDETEVQEWFQELQK